MKKEILFFEPKFKTVLWGGNRLKHSFGLDIPGDTTGECWAVSALNKGDTECLNEAFKGKGLSLIYKENPELFGTKSFKDFPLLIKLIDAGRDLSLQVHPGDEYARAHEDGALGKAECWYILDADDNSTIVCGHNASSREELCNMIDAGEFDKLVREIPVKKGDFVQIDPGTLHTIHGGVLLLEIQQSSDITYRVYDYGRLVNGLPRELHTKQAKEVISVPSSDNLFRHTSDYEGVEVLVSSDCFEVSKVVAENKAFLDNEEVFTVVSCIEGSGNIEGKSFKAGDCFIIPAQFGDVLLSGTFKLIVTRPGRV